MIVRVNASCGFHIKPAQKPIQSRRPPSSQIPEPRPKVDVADRSRREALEQRAQVKAGAAHHDWKPAAELNRRNNFSGQARIRTSREVLIEIDDVDQVMTNAAPLDRRQLGAADLQAAVDLNRVATDDLSRESFGQHQAEFTFAGTRGTKDHDQWPGESV